MVDKAKLLAPRATTDSGMPEDDVEVPGIGTVRVRGLSRKEVLAVRKATDNDTAKIDGPRILVLERKMVAAAMLDPEMTEAEVAEWQDVSGAGEMEPVIEKIQKLSGLMEGAGKSGVQSV